MTAPPLVKRLDARVLKAAGIHPLERVLRDLGALAPGEAYEFVTPHAPDHVLEKVGDLGLRWTSVQAGPDEVVTTFTKLP
ncbi:MAG: DUF2249 domain-containing protein [Anaeromyxobacteraceae bacterium]|nr:DUF2249 domain-containing protein [Anaeromyxobacteraceae bacterium]